VRLWQTAPRHGEHFLQIRPGSFAFLGHFKSFFARPLALDNHDVFTLAPDAIFPAFSARLNLFNYGIT
jgi:hypothetical protein